MADTPDFPDCNPVLFVDQKERLWLFWISDLVARLKAERYKPQPSRRVYIDKDEHSKRPLGLPALEDKIVQKGIARILEAIYEQDFLDCSYGFRPNRSCHQAFDNLMKYVQVPDQD